MLVFVRPGVRGKAMWIYAGDLRDSRKFDFRKAVEYNDEQERKR